jgi:O-antigen ligase
MSFLNLNNTKKILYFLVLIFPLIIVLKSAAINIALVIISLISILLIVKRQDFFFKDYFIKFIIIFLSFIFINSLFQFHNIETIIKSLGNFRYLFLTFAVFITLENISKKNYFLFIYINFILIILIGLDILYQYNFNKNIFGLMPGMCDSNLENCVRFSGVFGSELIAGGYLSQIGLLIFFLIRENKKFNKNKFYQMITNTFILFLFLIILLTGERNALLIFLICIFLFYFLQKKIRIVNFLISNVAFLIILLLISQNSQSIKARYINFLDISSSKNDSGIIEKITNTPWSYHYQAGFELFLEKPLLGHGYKSFRFKCSETKIDKDTIANKEKHKNYRACSTHPHSYIIEFLSENGIVGFLFFIIFLFIICNKITKSRNYFNNDYLAVGIGSLIVAILFPLKPSGSFFSTFNASILFYLLGFFLYYTRELKK